MGGEWWTWNMFIWQLFHPTSTLVNNWLKIIIPGRNGLRTNFCKNSHYFHPCFSGASQNMAAGKIDYFIAIFLPYSPYKLDSKTRDETMIASVSCLFLDLWSLLSPLANVPLYSPGSQDSIELWTISVGGVRPNLWLFLEHQVKYWKAEINSSN